jgi:hypothetical protein
VIDESLQAVVGPPAAEVETIRHFARRPRFAGNLEESECLPLYLGQRCGSHYPVYSWLRFVNAPLLERVLGSGGNASNEPLVI